MSNLDEAKSIINEVLSRPEFDPKASADLSFLDKIKEFIVKVFDSINNFIRELLEKIFGNINITPPNISQNQNTYQLGIIIVRILLISAFIALVVFVYIKLIKGKKWRRKVKTLSEEEINEFISNTDLPYQLAEKYKAEGDYRLSLRYLFISLLIQLNKKEIIKIDKAKTNKQYIRELKYSCPVISDDFSDFTDAFAYHWYGFRSVSSELLDEWFEKYDLILERGVKADEEK